MRARDWLDVLAVLWALGIGGLALTFLDRSYIVILAPLSYVGAPLLLAAIVVNRRWWILLFAPLLAVPFVPWPQ